MNNKNKILIGCLALLLALSVGYALFSDTITINGTATAKGSFDITVTCDEGLKKELAVYNEFKTEGGFEGDSCSVLDDEISYSVNLLYPTATRYFTVKMTNTGTIPAKFTSEFAEGTGKTTIYNKDDSIFKTIVADGTTFIYRPFQIIMFEDENGKMPTTDEEYLKFVGGDDGEGNFTYYKLEPGQSVYGVITAEYGENDDQLLPEGGYFKTEGTSSFEFTQITE